MKTNVQPRWHKAKACVNFCKGTCYALQTNTNVILLDHVPKGQSRWTTMSMQEFNERLTDKSIIIKDKLVLKDHIEIQAVFKTAEDCSSQIYIEPSVMAELPITKFESLSSVQTEDNFELEKFQELQNRVLNRSKPALLQKA